MKRSHKFYFFIAFLLTIVSWVIAILSWNELPNVIPVHFGISGVADGWVEKSLFYVFLLPVIELLMTGMFYFFYYHPQYSNMPSTMWLVALDEKTRSLAFSMLQKMLIGTLIWVNILFTYLTYGMNLAAFDAKYSLSPEIMFGYIGAMLIWMIYWTVKISKLTLNINKIKRR